MNFIAEILTNAEYLILFITLLVGFFIDYFNYDYFIMATET